MKIWGYHQFQKARVPVCVAIGIASVGLFSSPPIKASFSKDRLELMHNLISSSMCLNTKALWTKEMSRERKSNAVLPALKSSHKVRKHMIYLIWASSVPN